MISGERMPEDFEVHEPEEELHVDERWLVSYADMMTLLFGLFVLLYSMYDKMDIVQDAAKKQFSAPANMEREDLEKQRDQPKPPTRHQLEIENENLRKQGAELQVLKKSKDDLQRETTQLKVDLQDAQNEVNRLKDQLGVARTKINAAVVTKPSIPEPEVEIQSQSQSQSQAAPPPADESGAAGEAGHRGHGLAAGTGRLDGAGSPIKGTSASMTVTATLPDGSHFQTHSHRITVTGIMLDDWAPVPSSQLVTLQVTREDGLSIELKVHFAPHNDGEQPRARITGFSGDSESVLRKWVGDTTTPSP